jgi:hypothetical protein
MSISRRVFIGHSATAFSAMLLGGYPALSAEKKWKDVVAWSHSWDAVDATTYSDDGSSYKIPPALRVDSVPDPNGGRPLLRDRGTIFPNTPPIPGTVYQASNSMFGGRPSWFSDTIIPHDPANPGYLYALQSMLNAVPDSLGAPDTVFAWSQPWWGALLVRGVGPFEGHNQAYIDGNPGMVTIGRLPKTGTVVVRCWPEGMVMGPMIDSGAPYADNTALVQWLANGTESWLEVNYRGADGVLVTKRAAGALGTRQMDQFHTGLSHTNYTSCIGLAKGIPTTAQTDAIRDWASPFIPEFMGKAAGAA